MGRDRDRSPLNLSRWRATDKLFHFSRHGVNSFNCGSNYSSFSIVSFLSYCLCYVTSCVQLMKYSISSEKINLKRLYKNIEDCFITLRIYIRRISFNLDTFLSMNSFETTDRYIIRREIFLTSISNIRL